MLPKTNRVDKKGIDLVFKQGTFLSSPNLTFKFILTKIRTAPRISFIAPKSVAKLAVKRNMLRRRGYAALGKHMDEFPSGIIGAFVFKKSEENISKIEDEIKNILTKID